MMHGQKNIKLHFLQYLCVSCSKTHSHYVLYSNNRVVLVMWKNWQIWVCDGGDCGYTYPLFRQRVVW